MRNYKGITIDGTVIKNMEEAKAFEKELAINAYKVAVEVFMNNMNLEASKYCDEKAEKLHSLGFGWDEIEAIEISVYEAVA